MVEGVVFALVAILNVVIIEGSYRKMDDVYYHQGVAVPSILLLISG
jgi:hypothetical protein